MLLLLLLALLPLPWPCCNATPVSATTAAGCRKGGGNRQAVWAVGDGLLRQRGSHRQQLLHLLSVFKLLQLQLIILSLQGQQALALLKKKLLGVAEGLLQLPDLVCSLARLPLGAVQLVGLNGAARHRTQQLLTLGLKFICDRGGVNDAVVSASK